MSSLKKQEGNGDGSILDAGIIHKKVGSFPIVDELTRK